jgi:hypothetical protein
MAGEGSWTLEIPPPMDGESNPPATARLSANDSLMPVSQIELAVTQFLADFEWQRRELPQEDSMETPVLTGHSNSSSMKGRINTKSKLDWRPNRLTVLLNGTQLRQILNS